MRALIDEIRKRGDILLTKDPRFLDAHGYQGHYPLGVIDYRKSHGPHLYATDGVRFYDATAYWNTNILDYAKHPTLTALLRDAGKLAMDAPTMSEIVSAEQAAFTGLLRGYWPKADYVFTEPSGSLAVTDACWTACVIVADKTGQKPRDMKGVVFEGAFHGRHDRSADATNTSPKVDFRQNPDHFVRCVAPVCVFDRTGAELNGETARQVSRSMAEVERAFRDPKTAYVITEYPFQAEGGARLVARDALRLLHGLCAKYGKLLIVDCIQMSGRSWTKTGVPFPSEALRYADMVTFGKVFRLCGFMARNPVRLGRGFPTDVMRAYPLHYGSTWVGRMDQALTGAAILETVTRKNLWKTALSHTERILRFLRKEAENGVIRTPRGRVDTAYVGWEFETKEVRDAFIRIMRDKYRIMLLTSGERSIRWAPFADATAKEISAVLMAIGKTCQDLRAIDASPKNPRDKRTMTPPAGRSK